jgi:hypothetical protein
MTFSLSMLSPRGLGAASCGLLVLTTACSSGPDHPIYDTAGDIPRLYQASYVSDAPIIDGKMDDLAWRKTDWTANFIDMGGSTISRPRHQSRAKLLWDREYLYIGVWMVEPNLETKPISSLGFDGLLVFACHDDSPETYQVITAEPGGRHSISVHNNNPEGEPLEILNGLKHAVALSGTLNQHGDADKGWWAEFALPWRELTTSEQASVPQAGAIWRVNLVRDDEQSWSPYFTHDIHDPAMWGRVTLKR